MTTVGTVAWVVTDVDMKGQTRQEIVFADDQREARRAGAVLFNNEPKCVKAAREPRFDSYWPEVRSAARLEAGWLVPCPTCETLVSLASSGRETRYGHAYCSARCARKARP